MSMGASKIMLTAEEFDNCPFEEDKRQELDEGELIERNVLMKLTLALGNYFARAGTGEALLSENLHSLSPSIRRRG